MAVFLLFAGSLGLGLFIANLDNFLCIWDEQYHALVAKHLLDDPFKPTLYANPLFDFDHRNWTGNHIWLHKQPLFLWQIAISLKIFGFNALAVRIPDILMHAFASIMVYRIGKISHSSNAGFYGAMFFTVAYYILELIAGKYSTDHNDLAFLFYMIASFWAWFEYQHSHKTYWILLIGIFSGCAVLVKWLVGLMIYAIWTIAIGVSDRRMWLKLRSYVPVLIAFFISLLVFLPWQFYIFHRYPREASFEFTLNADHFFRPVEYHGGDLWFHFDAIKNIYGSGDLVPFLLLAGLIILCRNATARIYRVAIVSAIIITFSFYTIAATKMTSFTIIVSPFAFLGLGALTEKILKFLSSKIRRKWFEIMFSSFALIAMCCFLINFTKIENYHSNWKPNDNCNRKADIAQMAFIEQLSKQLHGSKNVVFNADKRHRGHIAVMFYTDCTAYGFIPEKEQIDTLKKQSYKIAIADNDSLPDYIRSDTAIIKIK